MAVPVILAETIAVSELYILFARDMKGITRLVNKGAGIIVGWYFLIVFFYLLFKAVIPITVAGQWKTIIDVIAVEFY